jgi:hypothetical protein
MLKTALVIDHFCVTVFVSSEFVVLSATCVPIESIETSIETYIPIGECVILWLYLSQLVCDT